MYTHNPQNSKYNSPFEHFLWILSGCPETSFLSVTLYEYFLLILIKPAHNLIGCSFWFMKPNWSCPVSNIPWQCFLKAFSFPCFPSGLGELKAGTYTHCCSMEHSCSLLHLWRWSGQSRPLYKPRGCVGVFQAMLEWEYARERNKHWTWSLSAWAGYCAWKPKELRKAYE